MNTSDMLELIGNECEEGGIDAAQLTRGDIAHYVGVWCEGTAMTWEQQDALVDAVWAEIHELTEV